LQSLDSFSECGRDRTGKELVSDCPAKQLLDATDANVNHATAELLLLAILGMRVALDQEPANRLQIQRSELCGRLVAVQKDKRPKRHLELTDLIRRRPIVRPAIVLADPDHETLDQFGDTDVSRLIFVEDPASGLMAVEDLVIQPATGPRPVRTE
jgi:hypothetical protein